MIEVNARTSLFALTVTLLTVGMVLACTSCVNGYRIVCGIGIGLLVSGAALFVVICVADRKEADPD